MSNEVKRYSVRGQFDHGLNLMTTREVVLASDYAALEAECERLNAEGDQLARDLVSLLGVTAERDALAAELAAIRAAGGEQVEVVAIVDESDDGKFAEVVDVPGVGCTVKMGDKLMTVAQHQRIVATMAAELEQARNDALNLKVQRDSALENMRYAQQDYEQLRQKLEAARKQEPVQVVAVAVMRDDGDGGLVPDWLLEGGTAEMVEGMVLIAADDAAITGEDGHGEVFKLPPLAGQVSGQEWVPVSERLPEAKKDGRMVLAFVCGIVTTKATATVRELVQFAKEDGETCAVTHWMPLPAAPALLATPSMEV